MHDKKSLHDFSISHLVNMYNSFANKVPGREPVKKFRDKATAVKRVEKILRDTTPPSVVLFEKTSSPMREKQKLGRGLRKDSQKNKQTNKDFLNSNSFLDMCKAHSVEPTVRQVSKYRNKKGLLYKRMKGAL